MILTTALTIKEPNTIKMSAKIQLKLFINSALWITWYPIRAGHIASSLHLLHLLFTFEKKNTHKTSWKQYSNFYNFCSIGNPLYFPFFLLASKTETTSLNTLWFSCLVLQPNLISTFVAGDICTSDILYTSEALVTVIKTIIGMLWLNYLCCKHSCNSKLV